VDNDAEVIDEAERILGSTVHDSLAVPADIPRVAGRHFVLKLAGNRLSTIWLALTFLLICPVA